MTKLTDAFRNSVNAPKRGCDGTRTRNFVITNPPTSTLGHGEVYDVKDVFAPGHFVLVRNDLFSQSMKRI